MQPSLHDTFVPKAQNDYLPYALRRTALLGMLGMVLVSFLLANLHALLWQTSTWLTGAVLPAVVVDLTNKERQAETLPTLTRSATLDAAAKLKAEDMAKNGYFAHYSPTGVTPWHWFDETGYRFVHAGENLAVHFSDSGEVVEAWMESPTHRANIVNGNFREIGVGTAKGVYEGFDTVFVVQLFGTPAAAAPAAAATELPTITVRPEPVELTVDSETIPPTEKEYTVVAANNEADKEVAGVEADESVLLEDESLNDAVSIEEDIEPVVSTSHDVAATDVTEESISLYSTFMATSTDLPPLINTGAERSEPESNWFGQAVTRPNLILQVTYIVLGGLVAVSLLMAVVIEWRRQHPKQVMYGVLLLLLMSALFYMQSLIISGAMIG